MNSKKHKLPRRILAMLLAICMFVTMFPSAMFAVEGGTSRTAGTIDGTKENPKTVSSEDGITINKYVSAGTQEGQYDLTLEAYASDQLTTTPTSKPLDIVLVLDVSGSMEDPFIGPSTQYTPTYNLDESDRYYIKVGDSYRSVSYVDPWLGIFIEKGWSYWNGLQQIVVNPKTTENDSNPEHEQFYTASTTDGMNKMEGLKSAASTFIEQVMAKNDLIADENNKHHISIVKFANDSIAEKIGNDKIAYSSENYTQIVNDFTDNKQKLKENIDSLYFGGATAADFGLDLAHDVIAGSSNSVSDQLTGSRDNAEKVVVFFTDGSPTHYNGFDRDVADDTIKNALELKNIGAKIYSVGVFEEETSEIVQYMEGVSSNYPQAQSYNSLGHKESDKYYFTADDPDGLKSIFEGIADEVTTGTLTADPDADAVLSDTLSEYFRFPEGLSAESDDIKVQFAAAESYDSANKTFAFAASSDTLPEGSDPEVSVDAKAGTITVKGLNYKTNAAAYNSTTKEVTGGKFLITFPIKVDENAVLDNPVEGNMYPTNATTYDPEKDGKDNRAKLSYKSDEQVETNDDSTVLTKSPAVPVDRNALGGNGTDVTVQVYVDGEEVNNPLDYVTLSRDTDDTSYRYYKVSDEDGDGILDFDFNYYTGEGGSDCVDIEVALTDAASEYVLQGVTSYQSYGKSGTSNVKDNSEVGDPKRNTYTVDNVTASDEDNAIDCQIYLRSKYSVQYYQNDDKLTAESYTDTNAYIAGEDVKSTSDIEKGEYPASSGENNWMNWQNTADYKKAIEKLPVLPDAETDGNVVDGWFLGTENGTEYTPADEGENVPPISVNSDTADGAEEDHIIKLIATEKAPATYTITFKYEDGEGNEIAASQKSEAMTAGTSYNFDVSTDDKGLIPFKIIKDETNYVFDHFKDGSANLSGEMPANNKSVITAVYLVDANNNGVPDVYDATVTYKIVGGTWDGTANNNQNKVHVFPTKTFNDKTNQWEELTPMLGETVPNKELMQPAGGYINEGSWDTTPTASTKVTDGAVYTFTFVAKNAQMSVEKEIYSINGTTVDSQEDNTAKVGDTIIYKIEISNEGSNVDITGIEIVDTLTVGAGTEELKTFYNAPSCDPGKVANLEKLTLAKDAEPLTLYAKYEVTEAGQSIKNVVEVTSNETGDDPKKDETPAIDVTNQHDLTYDPNGGVFTKNDGAMVKENVTVSALQAGEYTLWQDQTLPAGYNSEGNPSYTDEENVLFMGWATEAHEGVFKLEDKEAWKGYQDKIIEDNAITLDKNTTVYAVWAKDENGNGTADVEETTYTLTYNSTSGSFGESESKTASVDNLLANAENESYTLWTGNETTADNEIVPEYTTFPSHANGENDVKILFAGWTTIQPEEGDDYVFDQGDQNIPNRITTVTITNEPVTVYAVWGYDRNNNGEPDINEELYTLTYNPNGGTFGADGSGEPANATNVLANEDLMLWTKDDDGTKPDGDVAWPVHVEADAPAGSVIAQDGQKVDVVMIGWAKERGEKEIYAAGEAYPEIVSTVKIPPSDTETREEVFAIWGYDENRDGIADAQQIVITPADITIYEGGNGYEGIVNGSGITEGDATKNGLPAPGYFLILPYQLDDKLEGADNTVNLSGLLQLAYQNGNDNRHWELKLYNEEEGVGAAQNKVPVDRNHDGDTTDTNDFYYVYQLEPTTQDQVEVRLEVREQSADGTYTYKLTDDLDFSINKLYEEYPMRLYNTPDLDRTAVTALVPVNTNNEIDENSETWKNVNDILGADTVKGIARGFGTLTIRGTKLVDPVAEIAGTEDQLTFEQNNGIAAQLTDNATTYYVNGSTVPVVNQNAVKFMADTIVDEENEDGEKTTDTLKDAVLDKVAADGNITIDEGYTFDFSYLDLVDTSNGNAYVTTDKPVAVYWQYPKGMSDSDDFYVVHFDGLDREFDADNLDEILESDDVNIKIYSADAAEGSGLQLERTQQGIKITTTSFSPFALVYDADQGGSDNPGGGGGWTPDGGDDGPDGLNTEDHFSYIVGYAEDYRTGEPTDNEDLWPVKPNNQITRAEVATIFYRLLEDEVRDEYDTTVNDFSDVSADSWYNQTVSTLASMEIVKGYEDGTFRPNAPITRAEFGAIATRFFAETGATYVPGTFSDVTGDEWYANAIQDAVNLGLIGGYPDGTVRPNNNITRAEACAIVNRTLGRVPDADHLLPEDVMKVWPDNNPTDWFYADMQEATNGHEYAWIEEDGHEIEEWTNLLDKDWTDR